MDAEQKNLGGRPTVMTPDMQEKICFRLAGGEPLRKICADSDFPAMSTVTMAIVQDRDGFRRKYALAREAGGFSHGDRAADVVDKVASGELDPMSARAMLDGLKWLAERMAPKSHAVKQEIDHTSSDGSMSPKGKNLDDFYGEADAPDKDA